MDFLCLIGETTKYNSQILRIVKFNIFELSSEHSFILANNFSIKLINFTIESLT